MKVVLLSLNYDSSLQSVDDLLEQHYTTTGWAKALYDHGVEITEVKRFKLDVEFERDGVKYVIVNDGLSNKMQRFSTPMKLFRNLQLINPDVVHVSGILFPFQVFMLRRFLPCHCAIVVQCHNGWVLHGVRELFNRMLNNVADGFFFTTYEQGTTWFRRDIAKFKDRIYPVMEAASKFSFAPRDITRSMTGVNGNPVFLWIGTLDNNKDPITVLFGFEAILQTHPEAKLYMIYSNDNLLADVQSKISSSDLLRDNVTLIGKVPHISIESYLNSADYFVLGSHYEGSGYSLSEALACGCVPIVTDIPSYRMMTDNGNIGALWQPGNVTSFIQGINDVMQKDWKSESDKCREYFNRSLSFDAIAKTAIVHYSTILQKRLSQK